MSLRFFHVVFIVCSTLISFGVGAWAVADYLRAGSVLNLISGVVLIATGAVLIWYGSRFFGKLKRLNSL